MKKVLTVTMDGIEYYFNTLKPRKCCLLLYGQKAF